MRQPPPNIFAKAALAARLFRGAAPALDKTGVKIPEELRADFAEGAEPYRTMLRDLRAIRLHFSRVKESDRQLAYAALPAIRSRLAQAISDIERAIPYAVCYVCAGKNPKGCGACRTTGWVDKQYWDLCVPREIKELRANAVNKTKEHHAS